MGRHWYTLVLVLGFGIVFIALATHAWPRDLGQWKDADPAVAEWYRGLVQPDTGISCCGEADAYWADEVHVEGDRVIVVVTDDRPDGPLMRQHVPVGTRYLVPTNKVTWKDHNPTGHIVIFLGGYQWVQGSYDPATRPILCFVDNSSG